MPTRPPSRPRGRASSASPSPTFVASDKDGAGGDPANPVMLGYYNADLMGTGADASPEGVLFIPADQSPSGKPLVLYSTEAAGTVVVWKLTES